jgi:hypothetical protein
LKLRDIVLLGDSPLLNIPASLDAKSTSEPTFLSEVSSSKRIEVNMTYALTN